MVRCQAHGHTGELPCPWPECPKGTEHDEFDAQLYDLESIRHHHVRRQWLSIDGGVRYCWDSPEDSAWLLANKLAREEISRVIPPLCPPPDEFYHYTDTAGLYGIVTSGQLWATDYEFLNDRSELKFSLEVANAALESIDHQRYSQSMSHFISEWRKDLEAKVANCRLYVASFSEDGDNLSLWRGYAAGGGVSIGFGRDLLSLAQSPGSILNRVVYSSEDQLRLIEIVAHLHLLSIEWDSEKALPERDRLEELHKGYFGGTLLRHLAFLKNPGFRDEREIRVAHIEDQAMYERNRLKKATRRFRPRGRLLVPYIALSEDGVGWSIDARVGDVKKFRLPLVRVNVSPQLDPTLEIRSIREFLDAHGFTEVEVSSSVIPYRP
jgi:hypothetical protein